jgi:hypothetical protein
VSIHAQAEGFAQLRTFVDRTADPIVMESDTPDGSLDGKRVAMALPAAVRVGDKVLAAGFLFHGMGTWSETTKRLGLRDGKMAVLEEWVIPIAEFNADEVFERVRDRAHAFPGADDFATIIMPPSEQD